MFKSLFTKLNAAHGIAFPIVLLSTFLIVSVLVAGLMPLISIQSKYVAHTKDQLIARYAAEAGVKRGLRLAYDYLNTPVGGNKPNPNTFQTTTATETLLSAGGINYTYTSKYIDGDTPRDPERIEVSATAKSNQTTADSMAWIVFTSDNVPGYSSPPLIDLITSANSQNHRNCYHWNYSSKDTNPWNIGTNSKGKQFGRPAEGTAENIILFDNNYEKSEFILDYNLKFTKTSGSGGIGVIYGATDNDTAYDFNAYCVKFNKSRQAFSVTKYTSQNSDYGRRPVELFINTTDAGPQSYGTATTEQAMFQPNGKDPSNSSKTSFNGVDNLGNTIGRSSIPFSEVKSLTGVDPSTNDADYSIRIETVMEQVTVKKPGSTTIENRLRQNIYLKPAGAEVEKYVKVLSFIDFSDVNPVTTYDLVTSGKTPVSNPKIDLERKNNPTKKIRTGLRCWDVQNCEFYNSDIQGIPQKVYGIRRIIWKR